MCRQTLATLLPDSITMAMRCRQRCWLTPNGRQATSQAPRRRRPRCLQAPRRPRPQSHLRPRSRLRPRSSSGLGAPPARSSEGSHWGAVQSCDAPVFFGYRCVACIGHRDIIYSAVLGSCLKLRRTGLFRYLCVACVGHCGIWPSLRLCHRPVTPDLWQVHWMTMHSVALRPQ